MVTYEIIIECDNCHHVARQSAPVEVDNAEQVFITALTSRYGWVERGCKIYCPSCAEIPARLLEVDSDLKY